MKRKEQEELNDCLEELERRGIFARRVNSGATSYNRPCPYCKRRPSAGGTRFVRFGGAGEPDIQGYMSGPVMFDGKYPTVPFFWEVKRSDGKLRPKQKEFLDKALNAGCYGGYGTYQDMVDYLDNLLKDS